MVKQILLLSGLAVSMSAFADSNSVDESLQNLKVSDVKMTRLIDQTPAYAKMNDGSASVVAPSKAPSSAVQWKRPAGQFWGSGLNADIGTLGYYFTPLIVRPWTEYTFENISTAQGTPSWSCEYYDYKSQDYTYFTSTENNIAMSYIRYETPKVPTLSYTGNTTYPQQYYRNNLTGNNMYILANNSISEFFGATMPVSSHYYSLFTRCASESQGIVAYRGADGYPGMQSGYWLGTNNTGINALATRFEKPDQPYLLNAVYFHYQLGQNVPKNIPMKAYVFKTVDDAKVAETQSGGTIEIAELGELLAVSESFIPFAVYSDDNYENVVKFEFLEKNPVTGAENAYSLTIEDDITIVVTGFDQDLGNGGFITSFFSADPYDEGYGNLGFLGSLEEAEDGTINYQLTAIKDFFLNSTLGNTVGGVLADVSYPWLKEYYENQPSEVKLANEGETTESVQGLSYAVMLMSTSQTDDFEVTFDGEEECDWLSITGVYDDMEVNQSGEEEFTGLTGVEFTAEPNPSDESRVSHVKISIPAATYEITFLQGSNAESAVDSITINSVAKYYDLSGRRVVNPDKGVYIKVNGSKAEKVVL